MKAGKVIVTVAILGVVTAALAGADEKPVHKYVGAAKCKMCHNAAAKGAQYTKWTEMKHAKAYATLGTDAAKEIAKKKGIEDPQKSADCLKCHQTGYGQEAANFAPTYKAEEGVQCEACHGAGSDYMAMPTMKGIRAGTKKAEDFGLVMPTKDTCTGCHNDQSPSFKGFDFSADSAKIAHPIPKS